MATKRKEDLTFGDKFCIFLARAIMVAYGVALVDLVIDREFKILLVGSLVFWSGVFAGSVATAVMPND